MQPGVTEFHEMSLLYENILMIRGFPVKLLDNCITASSPPAGAHLTKNFALNCPNMKYIFIIIH